MLIGVPKEIKSHEHRVGLVPSSVRELTHHGHEVLVEAGAGRGVGSYDDSYAGAGARITDSAEEIYGTADLLVKVKEPQDLELAMLRDGQILFTYLHLAAEPKLARALQELSLIHI